MKKVLAITGVLLSLLIGGCQVNTYVKETPLKLGAAPGQQCAPNSVHLIDSSNHVGNEGGTSKSMNAFICNEKGQLVKVEKLNDYSGPDRLTVYGSEAIGGAFGVAGSALSGAVAAKSVAKGITAQARAWEHSANMQLRGTDLATQSNERIEKIRADAAKNAAPGMVFLNQVEGSTASTLTDVQSLIGVENTSNNQLKGSMESSVPDVQFGH
jgi:hypothetical protein